jgi:hypothetical protein
MPRSVLPLAAFAALCLSLVPQPAAPQGPQKPQDPAGHLVLVITGDARALQVTAAVRKPDPFGGVPKGLKSDWSLSLRDAQGKELGSYPLDLSHFDMDPANVGKPPRVVGDTFRSTTVALPVNVPDFPLLDRIVILHGQQQLGAIDGTALRALLAAGGR